MDKFSVRVIAERLSMVVTNFLFKSRRCHFELVQWNKISFEQTNEEDEMDTIVKLEGNQSDMYSYNYHYNHIHRRRYVCCDSTILDLIFLSLFANYIVQKIYRHLSTSTIITIWPPPPIYTITALYHIHHHHHLAIITITWPSSLSPDHHDLTVTATGLRSPLALLPANHYHLTITTIIATLPRYHHHLPSPQSSPRDSYRHLTNTIPLRS